MWLQSFILSSSICVICLYSIILAAPSQDVDSVFQCYVCTSYMPQCQEVMVDDQNQASKSTCKSKCYLRVGEEEDIQAYYRGCFDGFMDVKELDHDYNGCKNQTWNGKTRLWCLCDEDGCNKMSIKYLSTKHQIGRGEAKSIQTDPYDYPNHLDNYNNYEYEEIKGYNIDTLKVNDVGKQKEYEYLDPYQQNLQNHESDYGTETYRRNTDDNTNRPQPVHKDQPEENQNIDPYNYHINNQDNANSPPVLNQYNENGHQYNQEQSQQETNYHGPEKLHQSNHNQQPINHNQPSSHLNQQAPQQYHQTPYQNDQQTHHYQQAPHQSKQPTHQNQQQLHQSEQSPNQNNHQNQPPSPYDVQFQFYPDVMSKEGSLKEQVYFGQASDMFQHNDRDTQVNMVYPSGVKVKYPAGPSNYIDAKQSEQKHNPDHPRQDDRVYSADYHSNLVQEPYYPYPSYAVDPYHYVYDSTTSTPSPSSTTPQSLKVKDFDMQALAEKIFCTKTGYYQNPDDCNAFVACIMDPHFGQPVMYPMRCPDGLDWDNNMHICRPQSPTCGSNSDTR